MGKEKTEKVAMEHWLHERIGPAYDALKADPGRAVTADQVRARLADVAQAIELARRVDAGLEPLTPFDPAEELTTAEAVATFLADADATGDSAYIERTSSRGTCANQAQHRVMNDAGQHRHS
ncbi:transcriptional regulator [Xanthomonas oryzae]|nr:transcriptional regulator [Xanthomonas oryzae pv. oryzicola]